MDAPRPRRTIAARLAHPVGQPVPFEGYIDDFEHGVGGVQFSLDDGATWTTYPTAGTDPDLGVRWRFEYTPRKPGAYVLKARAVDLEGRPSPVVESFAFEAALPAAQGGSPAYGSWGLRPVGSRPLGEAMLYRSGEIGQISAADALLLVNGLDVRTVYDIRNKWEIAARPEPYLAGVRMLAVEPSTETRPRDANRRLRAGVIGQYGEPEDRMVANYRRYASEYPLLGTVLRSFASQHAPALAHCVNGRDRTGVLCAVALRVAGYPMDYVMDDFLVTNVVNAALIEKDMAQLGDGMDEKELAILRSFLEARPSYLTAFFSQIDEVYGSFNAYIRDGLRLTANQRENIAAMLG